MRSALPLLLLPFAHASVTKIAGVYEPNSIVTDETAMDLDQNAIIFHLLLNSASGYDTAKEVYDNGSYTDTYATIELLGSNVPVGGVPKGTTITGITTQDSDVIGLVYESMIAGQSTLKFKYPVLDLQPPNHVGCMVGSLPEAWHLTGGCLQSNGTVVIEGHGLVSYKYSISDDNLSGRSFKLWSTLAESQMGSCARCPYKDYAKFKEYYGQGDYADEWINAALAGRSTSFANIGGADFSTYSFEGRTQAIMKATAYMTVPMKVIQKFEGALDLCSQQFQAFKDQSVLSWDEGVAFYTGSMALGVPGILMYALAEKRCKDFKTCGRRANELAGSSAYINFEMFDIFDLGQFHLMRGECDPIRDLIDRATNLMSIAVIQGTLRYAYKVGTGTSTTEKSKAEGAVFAASVLPRVYACSKADAKIIYENMKVGAPSTDFQAVLTAFESNYECMGIAPWQVGAIYEEAANGGDGGYLYEPKGIQIQTSANSATSSSNNSDAPNVLVIGLGVGLGVVSLLLVAGVLTMRKRNKGGIPMDGNDPTYHDDVPVV